MILNTLIHPDKPLRGRAKHGRGFMPPAMRIRVFEFIRMKQRTRSFDGFYDLGLRLPDMHTAEQRQCGGVHAVAHHRIDDVFGFHAVALAGIKIVHAISGR